MVVRSASLALLLSLALGVADAIRLFKEGPMVDAEGREFKTGTLRGDEENISRPSVTDGSMVHVHCTETSMIVVVKADRFQKGRLVSPGELFLGGAEHSQSSQCRAVAAGDNEYVIEAQLQDCGSKLSMSERYVIYSNKLVITPAPSHHAITRGAHAAVPVSCFYERTHFVSSIAPQIISASAEYSTEPSAFSLKLMTDDWTRERLPSNLYVGDLLHLEASYVGPDSGQLFIDSCVATLAPDATSVPRYHFIENHGCLMDAKQGGSNTLFHSRLRANSLQLQLNAFLFHQDSRNSIFVTCQLKVTSDVLKSSAINKACNYVHSRWRNVDGNDDVCSCCDSTCYKSSPTWSSKTNLRRLVPEDTMTCATVTLGPLMVFPSK